MKTNNILALTLALTLGGIQSASATLWTFTTDNESGSTVVTSSYDDVTQDLTYTSSSSINTDGLWIVLNDGPFPEYENEWAVYYADKASGNIAAYAYNANGLRPDSYDTPSSHITTYENALSVSSDGQEFSFSINVGAVNQYNGGDNWTGTQFASSVGLWESRGTLQGGVEFNADGSIVPGTFDFTSEHYWIEATNLDTVGTPGGDVPEPDSLLLFLGAGLLGLGMMRRRTQLQVNPMRAHMAA